VAIDRETVAVLSAWRRRQAEERLATGPAWQDHGLVFFGELGEPPHPETVTRWWREAVTRAGLPPIRLHARHTAATMLLRAGVPLKVVAQRLGHADVAVTMRVYQHITSQRRDQAAADGLGRALRRRSCPWTTRSGDQSVTRNRENALNRASSVELGGIEPPSIRR